MDRKTISIGLDAQAVAGARFEVSPGHELVRAVRALVAPDRFPAHRALLRRIRADAPPAALAELRQVVTRRGYLPDFLVPLAQDPAELGPLIRQASPRVVAAQLVELMDDGRCDPATVGLLASRPARTRDRLASAVESLWEHALAPHWTAMRTVLEADIRVRSSTLARHGFAAMVDSLHPTVRWTGTGIRRSHSQYAEDLAASDLVLVPSIFGWPNVQTSGGTGERAVLFYPAHNATSDWSGPPSRALGELLGQTRARVLEHLSFPATTTDVAEAHGLATSTAHHHLQVLNAAGLTHRHREGTAVWHLRTSLGDELVRPRVAREVSKPDQASGDAANGG